jgi:hypothetical protein
LPGTSLTYCVGAFVLLCLICAYSGLAALPPIPYSDYHSDKVLHFVSFFFITVRIKSNLVRNARGLRSSQASFYFILDTTRKRVLHLSLIVCTLTLGVGSEILQALIPVRGPNRDFEVVLKRNKQNGREFDYLDIAANTFGSLAALGLCAVYHRRMLDRKRAARGYRAAVGEGNLDEGEDLELGTGPQESGITHESTVDIDEELENWDEHATDDWDEDAVDGSSGTNGVPPESRRGIKAKD